MKKTFIRSIRFSDEMMEIINQQVGENFNQKFERLIYNCYMLVGEKEREIQRLDDQIKAKRDQLAKLQNTCDGFRDKLPAIGVRLDYIHDVLGDLM